LYKCASQEGQLNLYAPTFSTYQNLFDAFSKQFPAVKVNALQLAGGPLETRFDTEQAAGQHIADVVEVSDVAWANEEATKGAFAPYVVVSDSDYPTALKGVGGSWYPQEYGNQVMAYNTASVSKAQATALAKDGMLFYKDKALQGLTYGIADPSIGATAVLGYYYLEQTQGGEAAVKKLFSSVKVQVYPGNAQLAAGVASGQVDVAVSLVESQAFTQVQQGAPVQYSYANPKLGNSATTAISSTAPHPCAAKLWQQWLLSPSTQVLVQNYVGEQSVNTQVTDHRPVTKESWWKPINTLWSYDPDAVLAATPGIISLVNSLRK
jgi:ABC-type Fe3+ transport system substrate-binding protein